MQCCWTVCCGSKQPVVMFRLLSGASVRLCPAVLNYTWTNSLSSLLSWTKNCTLKSFPQVRQNRHATTKGSPTTSNPKSGSLEQNVLVYSYRNDKFFKLLTVFGGIQLVFWTNLAYFVYTMPFSRLGPQSESERESSNSFTSMVNRWLAQHHYRIATGCLALG